MLRGKKHEHPSAAEVEALWEEKQPVGSGGGGGASSSQLASEYGMAQGTASSMNLSFSWIAAQPRHEFNEEGFRIWRKSEGGTWQQVGSVPANTTSLTIPAP